MNNEICNIFYTTSISSIPSNQCSSASQFLIPGWNDHVRDAHTETRYAYVTWRDLGKPRHGPDLMKITRSRFMYALRQCQAMEDTARADALAKSLADKDTTSFWTSVKRMNNKKVPQATSVNDVVGSANICDMWKTHYSQILNCVSNTEHNIFSRQYLFQYSIMTYLLNDLLAAEHYKHAHPILAVLLALLFTSCVTGKGFRINTHKQHRDV